MQRYENRLTSNQPPVTQLDIGRGLRHAREKKTDVEKEQWSRSGGSRKGSNGRIERTVRTGAGCTGSGTMERSHRVIVCRIGLSARVRFDSVIH